MKNYWSEATPKHNGKYVVVNNIPHKWVDGKLVALVKKDKALLLGWDFKENSRIFISQLKKHTHEEDYSINQN